MARMEECIVEGCGNIRASGSFRCVSHGGLVSPEMATISEYRKPRPEWWTPSEHCQYHPIIKLSCIAMLDRSRPGYKDHLIMVSGGLSDGVQSYDFSYDTAEHRDEDFERLKEALGI